MSEKVYQILYCSRNSIQGSDAEVKTQIEGILEASRRNNARVGVTGALFYNTVFFAQVLEGNFADVQGVFERLQLDPRHSDLVVLQSGYVPKRDFEGWSMAYAGASSDYELPLYPAGQIAGKIQGEQVATFLRSVVHQQENWALPSRVAAARWN